MIKIRSRDIKGPGAVENLCANCFKFHKTADEARFCAHTGALELEMMQGIVRAECDCGGAIMRTNTQGIFPLGHMFWEEKNPCGLKILLKCIIEKYYLRQGSEFAFSDEIEIATIEEAMVRGWLPRDPIAFIRIAESEFVQEFQRVLYLLEEGELEVIDTSWAA